MKLTFGICGFFLLSSCATPYHSINPQNITYSNSNYDSKVELRYKFSVLAERGNLRYHNRELKKRLHVVAVRITNYSDSTITIGVNAFLHQNGLKITPVDSFNAFKSLKQPIFGYLLYAFVAPYPGRSYNKANKYLPYLYTIAIGIPAFNMFRAKHSNKLFYEELKQYDLINRPIRPGETAYGLIPIYYFGYEPLLLIVE